MQEPFIAPDFLNVAVQRFDRGGSRPAAACGDLGKDLQKPP